MTKTIYLPKSAMPKYRCELCGAQFYAEEEDGYGKHMKKCSDANEEAVMARSRREAYKELLAVGDHERDAWVKKHRTEIIEGRKTM
jgi:transposase-like protein